MTSRLSRVLGLSLALWTVSPAVPGAWAIDPQTAATITGGALLGIGLAVQALTNSTLDVTVEIYAPADTDLPYMSLGQAPVLARVIDERRRLAADPLVTKDPQAFLDVASRLLPVMTGMECLVQATQRSITELNQIIKTLTTGSPTDPKTLAATAAIATISKDLQSISQASADSITLWHAFQQALPRRDLVDANTLDSLSLALFRLRAQLSQIKQYQVGREYLDLLASQLQAALIADVSSDESITDKSTAIGQISAVMNPLASNRTASGLPQLATVLDSTRQAFAIRSGAWPEVDQVLLAFGLNLTVQTLSRLQSKAAILAALSGTDQHILRSNATGVCTDSVLLTEALSIARSDAIAATYTYSLLTSDFNLGPLRNEAMQVLMAGSKRFEIITNPANEARWRPFSQATSTGGTGNLDSVVYFENMGHPIVKTSAFDPTKFIVAHGALYRRVFSAAAGVLGAPASTPATAKDGTPGTNNVFMLKARLQTATKSTAAIHKHLLNVLKTSLDEQSKAKAAQAPSDWSTKRAALVKEARDALDKLVQALQSPATTP